ncbi:MAG: prolyl oligopeptidase family serine peptidase [Lentisphaeria bacterium]|nr:prolyl oligopeptidase family serine peptidase [Lentisphaeria bacterium]
MMEKITYHCSWDNSMQEAMIRRASAPGKPLAVTLHTWGGTVDQDCSAYIEQYDKLDWNMIYPDFRGPNRTPLACGSDAVASDIADAVKYAVREFDVDTGRIYLIGGSGGGHLSLLLARRMPDLWAAVSAWCPIFDIALWHDDCLKDARFTGYSSDIEAVLGGDPAKKEFHDQALYRSAAGWEPTDIPLDISTGIHDGHTGSVPVYHSIRAFNTIAAEKDRISEEDIDFIVKNEAIPAALQSEEEYPLWGGRKIHFRRVSGNVRLTIFEGGHDLFPSAGTNWLSLQSAGKKAKWHDADNDRCETAATGLQG